MTNNADRSSTIVNVALKDRSYPIVIGRSLLPETAERLSACLKSDAKSPLRALVVTDAAVADSHAAAVLQNLRSVRPGSSGVDAHCVVVPSGEPSKSSALLQLLYDALVDMQADRKTVVIAVGGGVIGDLAGFAAATYARGLRFFQVPTTLLAMVDSSVGGKTGINHPRGKNLIGAFHQPCGVLIDLLTLDTLPDREFRAGLAEVVKYGVILDEPFFRWLEGSVDQINNRDAAALQHIVARCCELKAQVVAEDEFETTGLRAVLNYGHTFGHAFEALAGYGTLLHGEAVSIGMLCASRLAESLGRISCEVTRRQSALLSKLGLPVDVPSDLAGRHEEILAAMLLDKKTESRELRFVLPSRIGHVEVVKGVSPDQAMAALCTAEA